MYATRLFANLAQVLRKGLLATGLLLASNTAILAQQESTLNAEQQKNLQEIANERLKEKLLFQRWLTPERIKELGLVLVAGADAPSDPVTGAMLVGLDIFGKPKFYKTTSNVAAGITTSTNRVMVGGDLNLNLTGATRVIHEWDGGRVRSTHQELNGRVTQADGATSLSDHATHVAGTMIASGIVAQAKGMATQATISAYSYNNDIAEITTAASGGARISNHSYGQLGGWEGNRWYGTPSVSETDDYKFGFYDNDARDLDRIAFNAPFYLMLWAAGNDRADTRVTNYQFQNSNGTWVPNVIGGTNPTPLRDPDGPHDCILPSQTAKNILTIGAVNAVAAGLHGNPNSITMSSFSSWGPTDDGRIKPDLVAQGTNVYSSTSGSNTEYETQQGTSMATPNATGSLALMQEYFKQIKNREVLSATLKAFAINTAFEAGNTPGPDYGFGWGLLNTAGIALAMQNDGTTSRLYESRLNQGQTYTTTFSTSGNNIPKLTMVWTDPEATVFTATASLLNNRTPKLVNDLDVRLVSPTGIRYQPWVLDPANPNSAATRSDNIRDNVEQVIGIAQPGEWTIEVTHKGTLRNGGQNFSIVVTGASLTGCPQVPTIFANGITNICQGNSVTLVGPTGTGLSYIWSNGETTKDIEVTQQGNYTLRTIANNCTTNASNPIEVTITNTQPPARPVITASGPITFAVGGSVTLSAPSGVSYLWNTGATTRTINVTTSGSYTVRTLSGSCTSELSSPVHVVVTGGVCSGNITLSAPSGNITDGPGNYVANASCTWLINGMPNSLFRFNFSSFSTERNYDFVRVYNGTNSSGNLVAEFSGTSVPAPFEFVGTNAFVTFTSDGTTQSSGFDLNYAYAVPCTPPATPEISALGSLVVPFGSSLTLQPNVPSGQGFNYIWSNGATTRTIEANVAGTYTCRVIRNNCTSMVSNPLSVTFSAAPTCSALTSLEANNGVISDGGTNYGNNMSCTWRISRPIAGTFRFNFLQFSTESGYDFVTIYNGTDDVTGTQIGRYSGTSLPPLVTFSGTDAFITFTSDGSQTSSGFNIAYSFRSSACDSIVVPMFATSGSQTLCTGGSLTLNGPSGINYLWSNGETQQNLVVTNSGTYTLRSINGECTSNASAPIEVTLIDQLPIPTIVSSGNTTICSGQSVSLEGPAGFNYIWSNGETTQVIEARNAGNYSLRVTNGSCTSEVSSTIIVNVLPSPARPIISLIGRDSLDAGVAANRYIWNYNNQLISGSGRKIAIRGAGEYIVRAIGDRNCQSPLSETFLVTSAAKSKAHNVLMYPNPSQGEITLVSEKDEIQQVELFSTDGKRVYTKHIFAEHFTLQLPVKAGTYLVAIQTRNGKVFERLIIK